MLEQQAQQAGDNGGTVTTAVEPADNGAAGAGGESTGDNAFKPITSQDDLNRILNDRLTRERAKYKDFADLKAKAEQFDAITEAQKTELQKATERADLAERRAADLESEQQRNQWKDELAKEFGLPAGVLRGQTEEELRAHATSLKELLPDPRKGASVSTEGRGGTATASPAQEFAELFNRARG